MPYRNLWWGGCQLTGEPWSKSRRVDGWREKKKKKKFHSGIFTFSCAACTNTEAFRNDPTLIPCTISEKRYRSQLASRLVSMSKAVKEAVKESLLGSEESAQLSSQTKARFNSNATKDPETGELFMGAEEFVNAIAPDNEDYVSPFSPGRGGQRCGVLADRSELPDRSHCGLQLSWSLMTGGHSTKSSASNMGFCLELQTAEGPARSPSPTGPPSKTSS